MQIHFRPFLLANTLLFLTAGSLSLSAGLTPFKQLKSDYSSSQCGRDPHDALLIDGQSSTPFLADGQTRQFFRISSFSYVQEMYTLQSVTAVYHIELFI